MTTIKACSLNLFGAGPSIAERLVIFEDWIRSSEPDVVALQEVPEPELLDGIARRLGYELVHVPTGTLNNRDGLATLSRVPVAETASVQLPVTDGLNPRKASLLRVRLGQKYMGVINTHLSYGSELTHLRLTQVETILSSEIRPRDPLIFCGDLNSLPTEGSIRQLRDNHIVPLTDVWKERHGAAEDGATFCVENEYLDPEIQDRRRYDYIFRSDTITSRAIDIVFTTYDDHRVSDHYGLFATLEVEV